MFRSIVSVMLSMLFMLFLVAPTVIMMVDDSYDVSIFYTANEEEEEKKGQKKDKEKELFLHDFPRATSGFDSGKLDSSLVYFFKKYAKPHLNLISPPPDTQV